MHSSGGEIELSDVIRQRVEDIWHREKQRRKDKLFNGQVLSLIEYSNERLLARFVEYKLFLAYVGDPSLRKDLDIKPLSLSCITRTSKAVLIGRRSRDVLQYPLFYELAPSGGIDAEARKGEYIDVNSQALRELEEETGYLAKDVQEIKPFALVLDESTGIYEVCVEIVMSEGIEQFLKATPEYDKLEWVPYSGMSVFIEKHVKDIVPFSLHLLEI